MREALGALCLAAALLVIGAAGAWAGGESVADVGFGLGVLFAVVGLVALAVELLRQRATD